MASNPSPDLVLTPTRGEARTVSEWLTMFHLVLVAVDPFNERSAWIVGTAGRIMSQYEQADCRVAWLVGGTPEEAHLFLGPWADRAMVFADPDLAGVRGLGLAALPAVLWLAHDGSVVDAVEGWLPERWRDLTENLSRVMGWSHPVVPAATDPAPFEGAPVGAGVGD